MELTRKFPVRRSGLAPMLLLIIASAATATMMSLTYSLVVRPLPIESPEEVVSLSGLAYGHSLPSAVKWWAQADALDALTIYAVGDVVVNERGTGHWKRVASVSPDFFDVFRTPAVRGRYFDAREHGASIAVISESLWRSMFGQTPSILGTPIYLNSVPHTVVGVAPTWFEFPAGTAIWIPTHEEGQMAIPYVIGATALPDIRRNAGFVGRLKPGRTESELRHQLTALLARANAELKPQTGVSYGDTVGVRNIEAAIIGDIWLTLRPVMAAAALLMIVAIFNVAFWTTLHFAKARQTLSIKLSLGATASRLKRELVVSGIVAGVLCGASASALSYGLLIAARGFLLDLAILVPISTQSVAIVCVGAFVLTFLATALPTIALSMVAIDKLTLVGTRDHRPYAPRALRRALVIAQVALACVLIAGMYVAIVAALARGRIDYGYRTTGIVTVEAALRSKLASTAELKAWRENLLVTASDAAASTVAISSSTPFSRREKNMFAATIADVPAMLSVVQVTHGYKDVFQLNLLEGRFLKPDENNAAVVNNAAARQFWGDTSPIGQSIRLSSDLDSLLIVGVVKDTRPLDASDTVTPELYRPMLNSSAQVALRVPMSVTALCESSCDEQARRLVEGLSTDPRVSIYRVRHVAHQAAIAEAPRRLQLYIWLTYAAAAVASAVAGVVYLVLGVALTFRREVSIRVALGAQRSEVLWFIARDGVVSTTVGVVVGLTGAMWLRSVIYSAAVGVEPFSVGDGALIAAAFAGVLSVISLIAAAIASRKPVSLTADC